MPPKNQQRLPVERPGSARRMTPYWNALIGSVPGDSTERTGPPVRTLFGTEGFNGGVGLISYPTYITGLTVQFIFSQYIAFRLPLPLGLRFLMALRSLLYLSELLLLSVGGVILGIPSLRAPMPFDSLDAWGKALVLIRSFGAAISMVAWIAVETRKKNSASETNSSPPGSEPFSESDPRPREPITVAVPVETQAVAAENNVEVQPGTQLPSLNILRTNSSPSAESSSVIQQKKKLVRTTSRFTQGGSGLFQNGTQYFSWLALTPALIVQLGMVGLALRQPHIPYKIRMLYALLGALCLAQLILIWIFGYILSNKSLTQVGNNNDDILGKILLMVCVFGRTLSAILWKGAEGKPKELEAPSDVRGPTLTNYSTPYLNLFGRPPEPLPSQQQNVHSPLPSTATRPVDSAVELDLLAAGRQASGTGQPPMILASSTRMDTHTSPSPIASIL